MQCFESALPRPGRVSIRQAKDHSLWVQENLRPSESAPSPPHCSHAEGENHMHVLRFLTRPLWGNTPSPHQRMRFPSLPCSNFISPPASEESGTRPRSPRSRTYRLIFGKCSSPISLLPASTNKREPTSIHAYETHGPCCTVPSIRC